MNGGEGFSSSSDVATVLRAALLALQKAHPVMLRVGLHEHVAMVAPPPSPPPPRLAAAEGAMPPPPTLRPHRALLPLDEPAKVERELPSDASPHIMRVMNVANPLRSLQQVADETGTTIKMLFRVAEHLRTWGKVRFIHPLAEHSVLRIHPDASRDTPATEFRHLFGESEPSFAKVFKLFASAQSFGDVVRVSELIPLPMRHLVRMATALLRDGVLQSLHTHVHTVDEPHEPPSDAPESEHARWRLYGRLRPMLHGQHYFEEIMWQERVPGRPRSATRPAQSL